MQRGVVFMEFDGWKIRLNPNPDVKDLPDEQVWQLLSPTGKVYSGGMTSILYLASDEGAAGWRNRHQ